MHLGYLEKDAVRGGDSYNTFKEILDYAKKLQVLVINTGDSVVGFDSIMILLTPVLPSFVFGLKLN